MSSRTVATPSNDPRTVKRLLKKLQVRGNHRAKIVTLRDEALLLDISSNPFAFCFLLRSMFEISAKAYCNDHASSGGPSYTDNGRDIPFWKLLDRIHRHMTNNGTDEEKKRLFTGAYNELKKDEGVLSVNSLNQLIHNTTFSPLPSDICLLFGNVFPFLEAMNNS